MVLDSAGSTNANTCSSSKRLRAGGILLIRTPAWKAFPQLQEFGAYVELVKTAAVMRLADIAFLGAIDRLHRRLRSGTRFDHSISVAYLAYLATLHLEDFKERETAIAAALLHDIGHGPLSHSSEGYFRRQFGIDHKTEGRRKLRTDREIRKILKSNNLQLDRIENLVFGKEKDPLSYLFHLPINIDTIEGITRCIKSFQIEESIPPRSELVQLLVSPDKASQAAGDAFWQLKEAVYNQYILSPKGVIHDLICQLALEDVNVLKEDFNLGDTEFDAAYGHSMNEWILAIRESVESKQLTPDKLAKMSREFGIRQEFEIREPKDLALRYG